MAQQSAKRTPPPVSIVHARVMRSQAHRQRFTYLQALNTGDVTMGDVIRAACADGGKYLRRIRLHRLLATQPGWADKRAQETLTRFLAATASPHVVAPTNPDIAWLVDPRAGGRRLSAWANTVGNVAETPWPGFPTAPKPSDKQKVQA